MKSHASKHIIILLVFTCLAFGLYWQTLHAPFIFDDHYYIKENTYIHLHTLSLDQIGRVLEGPSSNRAISMLSFAINHYFSGLDPFGFHVTNILIHIINAFLLFLFIKQFLHIANKHWPKTIDKHHILLIPTCASLLWLCHPLHTQSVSYLSQRMNSLGALFFISSLLCYSTGRLRYNQSNLLTRKCILLYILSFTFALCGFFSKQNTATLPFFIILHEWMFFQKADFTWLKKKSIWLALAIIPAICLLAFVDLSDLAYFKDPPLNKWLTELRVNAHYISLIFFPHPSQRVFDYDLQLSESLFKPITTLLSLIGFIGIIGLISYALKRNKLIAYCLIWYCANLVIESLYVRFELICEYRTYLPSMLLPVIIFQFIKNKKTIILTTGILALIFSTWTYQRNHIWSDDLLFWQDNVQKSPNKSRPLNNLGLTYAQREKHDIAIPLFRKAINLDPQHGSAYYNLGNSFLKTNDIDRAIRSYKIAIKLKPSNFEAHSNLANAYNVKHNFKEALKHYQIVLKNQPYHKFCHNNISSIYRRLNKQSLAKEHISIALELDPLFVNANINMGMLLLSQGQKTKSITHFQKALDVEPKNLFAKQKLEAASK